MARSKPTNLYPVKNIDQANQVLAELASIKRSKNAIADKCNAKIDRIKAESDAQMEPLKLRQQALENGLLAFAEFNKDELFAQRRSKTLIFGSLGYRKSTEIQPKPKGAWKRILGKIKELDLSDALRIKEEVNRDELSQWTDERLDMIGARRVVKDVFWYELDEQALAETAN